ncbi:MAG: hypothetical protein HZT43_00030 [Exiguobacterium profundum]|nr:MAG: hypothetical protein HZT43_00030 [Exiguobacterium profundum]
MTTERTRGDETQLSGDSGPCRRFGGAAWYYTRADEAAVTAPTVVVDRGTVEQTVLATGAVEAMKLVSVGAQVSGRIES